MAVIIDLDLLPRFPVGSELRLSRPAARDGLLTLEIRIPGAPEATATPDYPAFALALVAWHLLPDRPFPPVMTKDQTATMNQQWIQALRTQSTDQNGGAGI